MKMKKLNLNLAGSIQSLTKEQMKKINGGYGPACGLTCMGWAPNGICANSTDGCTACVGLIGQPGICMGGAGWGGCDPLPPCSQPNECPYCWG